MARQQFHHPDVDRPVIAVAKEFVAGSRIGLHSHVRAQLIFAVEGLMVATTAVGTWVVPPGYALWVPPGIAHDVAMHGAVSMRTAYVLPDGTADLPARCQVIDVSPLLETTLVELCAEQPAYDKRGRGGYLAALILAEIARASATPFALPVPSDRRLAKLARHLIKDPASARDIDHWADEIGASRRTLTRLFRAQTGLSFGTWRRRLRLLAAVTRLADGEPPARVAASVGYRSIAAFRAMARRELGTDFDQMPFYASKPPKRRDTPLVIEAARAWCLDLTRRLKWPSSIAALDGAAVVVRFSTIADSAFTPFHATINMRLSLISRALGRAYLAFCPPEERAILVQLLKASPDPEDHPHDLDGTVREITRRVRRLGYAERNPNVEPKSTSTVAVPILFGNRVLATLGLTYFRSAVTPATARKELVPPLKEAAQRIEQRVAQLLQVKSDREITPSGHGLGEKLAGADIQGEGEVN